jgi:hypothetical protein
MAAGPVSEVRDCAERSTTGAREDGLDAQAANTATATEVHTQRKREADRR